MNSKVSNPYGDLSKFMKGAIKLHRKTISTPLMPRERVLTLSFGRCCGHSTFIFENATQKDIIIVHNKAREINQLSRFLNCKAEVLTAGDVKRDRYFGKHRPADTLWIDGMWVSEELSDIDFHKIMGYFQPVQIVVLGK